MNAFIIEHHSDSRGGDVNRAIVDALGEVGVEIVSLQDFAPPGSNWRVWVEDAIARANLVIADFTDAGPDMTYEVGLARGMRKRVLPIVQRGDTDAPLVIDGEFYFVYDPADLGKLGEYVASWARGHVEVTEGVASGA